VCVCVGVCVYISVWVREYVCVCVCMCMSSGNWGVTHYHVLARVPREYGITFMENELNE